MALIKGPNSIKWGDNEIEKVEDDIELEHEQDSEDYESTQGQKIEVDGPMKTTATIMLLASDIPAIAALCPQNFVPNGQELSTGETVNYAEGAIEVKARDCDEDATYNNFDIISCNNPAQVVRLVNARTRFDGYEVTNKLHKARIKIIAEPEEGEANLQIFKEGTINTVS